MVSTRSRVGIARESALSNVVLPAPVAPATSTFQPARTIQCRNRSASASTANSRTDTARAPNRRIVTHGPSTASGGRTAWSREPSAKRASTMGDERSRRRPRGAITRSAMRTMPAASRVSASGSTTPSRSTKARPGPLSITSVTAGSARTGSSTPRPTASCTSSVSSASNRSAASRGSSTRRCSARRARTTTGDAVTPPWPASAMSRACTRSLMPGPGAVAVTPPRPDAPAAGRRGTRAGGPGARARRASG